jgi:hypothetical protein
MKIVRPLESTAPTHSTGVAEIVSDDFPVFHLFLKVLINSHTPNAARTRAETKYAMT